MVTVLVEAVPQLLQKRAQVVLLAAPRAVVGELAARHRQEQPVVAVDELDVADDEGVVEGQRAERLEAALGLVAQINAYFCQMHTLCPYQKSGTRRGAWARRSMRP